MTYGHTRHYAMGATCADYLMSTERSAADNAKGTNISTDPHTKVAVHNTLIEGSANIQMTPKATSTPCACACCMYLGQMMSSGLSAYTATNWCT